MAARRLRGAALECASDDECGPNEVCDGDGQCVAACNPWGMGSYGHCLDDYGGFDSVGQCGAGHLCVYYGSPIQATACSWQGCGDVCECPGPPATGPAVMSCGDITGDGQNDCHLSCVDGRTCPDGTVCLEGSGEAFCMSPPPVLPMYGNCGAVDASCVAGTQCVVEGGFSVCLSTCTAVSDCDPVPPGAAFGESCGNAITPPVGNECHIPCDNDSDCPSSMQCVSPDGVQLCLWPP